MMDEATGYNLLVPGYTIGNQPNPTLAQLPIHLSTLPRTVLSNVQHVTAAFIIHHYHLFPMKFQLPS